MLNITAQQSRDARRELGLSQADVAKTLDFNRQYLSEFETGFSTRLTNAQLKKLRKFYEAKIEEANENGEEITITFGEPEPEQPTIAIENYHAKRLAFKIGDEVSDKTLSDTLEVINDNDDELITLLPTVVSREESFFGSGKGALSEASLESLRRAFTLLSINYLLIRTLTGWPKLGLSASDINPVTDSILDVIINDVYEWFQHFEENNIQENEAYTPEESKEIK